MEVAAAEAWIVSRLKARAALAGVDMRHAPAEDSATEGIVWKCLTPGFDTLAVGVDEVIAATLLYQVTAYVDGDDVARANALANEVQAALQGSEGANNDGVTLSCARKYPVRFVERSQIGRRRQVMGGVFQLDVQGA